MRIYVAGPYGDSNLKHIIARNVAAADAIGRELALLGHTPYIPHKTTWGWEDDPRITYDDCICIDLEWLGLCDALFFLGPSPGANLELEVAVRCGKRIFVSIGEVPKCLS